MARAFREGLRRLTPQQQTALLRAIAEFVEDLQRGGGFRKSLRVKGVKRAIGIFEMTWADDGRATFEYGEPVRERESHVVWRRIGAHAIFNEP